MIGGRVREAEPVSPYTPLLQRRGGPLWSPNWMRVKADQPSIQGAKNRTAAIINPPIAKAVPMNQSFNSACCLSILDCNLISSSAKSRLTASLRSSKSRFVVRSAEAMPMKTRADASACCGVKPAFSADRQSRVCLLPFYASSHFGASTITIWRPSSRGSDSTLDKSTSSVLTRCSTL